MLCKGLFTELYQYLPAQDKSQFGQHRYKQATFTYEIWIEKFKINTHFVNLKLWGYKADLMDKEKCLIILELSKYVNCKSGQ